MVSGQLYFFFGCGKRRTFPWTNLTRLVSTTARFKCKTIQIHPDTPTYNKFAVSPGSVLFQGANSGLEKSAVFFLQRKCFTSFSRNCSFYLCAGCSFATLRTPDGLTVSKSGWCLTMSCWHQGPFVFFDQKDSSGWPEEQRSVFEG